jgi:hypothetical protein
VNSFTAATGSWRNPLHIQRLKVGHNDGPLRLRSSLPKGLRGVSARSTVLALITLMAAHGDCVKWWVNDEKAAFRARGHGADTGGPLRTAARVVGVV